MAKHLRLTDEEFAALKGRVGHGTRSRNAVLANAVLAKVSPTAEPGSPPSPYKSKWEVSYANYLDALKLAGEIVGWWYEPVRFLLPGKRNTYKGDFLIRTGFGDWNDNGILTTRIEIHEVKGWSKNRREGITKLKTAAGLNTWATFYLVQWDRKRRAWDKQLVQV